MDHYDCLRSHRLARTSFSGLVGAFRSFQAENAPPAAKGIIGALQSIQLLSLLSALRESYLGRRGGKSTAPPHAEHITLLKKACPEPC